MTNHHTRKSLAARLTALVPVVCLLLATSSAHASTNNLLINGDFNAGSTGWETWAWHSESWGSDWANFEIPDTLNPEADNYNPDLVGVYDGTLQLTVGANGDGGAGAYQIIAATAGVEYTLTVQNGVEDWWKPVGEIRMIWLDEASGEITRDVVLTTCSINADCGSETNDLFDVGVPYANWTNIATAPVGTKFLKVELTDPVGIGSVYFDNASLTAPIEPPVIADLYPDGSMLLQGTNTLSFTAISAVAIDSAGIKVVLNGVNVSEDLLITGPSTNVSVRYTGLELNASYGAEITVTDTANLSTLTTFNFDTYSPIFTWEAEDYDFDSGQYINNPVPSDAAAVGSYFGQYGTEGVDFHDQNNNGSHDYRSVDWMGTELAGEPTRQAFVDAGASDYNVGWFDGAGFSDNVGITSYDAGEWVNHTRDFPAGTYNIYGRLANGNGGVATIPLSKVVSGQGTTTQTTEELGAFRFPANGWGSYDYVPLTDEFGNRIAMALSGTTTLRVTAGSGGNLNFFMVVSADTELPTITDVYPDGRVLLQGTNALTFTVSSASHSIAQSNVVVTLNGMDVSSGLSFSGSGSSWDVTGPLHLGVTNYTAVISVSDDQGNSHSVTLYFDTLDPMGFVVEAEDFDFDGGQFIDNPLVTSVPAPDSYFGKIGTSNVDSSVGEEAPPTTADFRYRDLDDMATSQCTDTLMRNHVEAQLTNALAFNYNVGWWSSNAWLNFSRTYPAGNFHVYARLAGDDGEAYSISLDEVNGAVIRLGEFAGVGRGYNFFDWIPLVETNSQLAVVTLGGVTTLRATTGSNVNPNNFVLVPVVVSPEELQWSYAGSVLTFNWSDPAFHLQVQTNAPGMGITTTWSDYPEGGTSPVPVTVDQSEGSLFFRLSD